jgi:hypothetical protein
VRLKTDSIERAIYSISVADVVDVADNEFSVKLTEEEIKRVEDRLGDYIDWHEALSLAISDVLEGRRKSRGEKSGRRSLKLS